jgi:hypothetical protein
MSARTAQILSRFPAHLEPARPGKQLVAVTDALAGALDQVADRIAAIRRAHRLADADELRDLMLLAGIHGISDQELGIVTVRGNVMSALAANLTQAADGAAANRDQAANAILDLWGIEGDSRLALFAPAATPSATPDLAAASHALIQAVHAMLGYRSLTDAVRTSIRNICVIGAQSGPTVGGILRAAANALDLDIDSTRNASVRASLIQSGAAGTLNLAVTDGFFHSSDLFWHSTFAINRTPLVRSVPSIPPPQLALMSDTITVAELAAQMHAIPDQVVQQMAVAGITPARQDASLDLATAEKVAVLFQYAVERMQRGVVTMEAAITVTDLSRQIGVTAGEIVARLAPIGIANATRDTALPPDTAVLIARKYGFSLRQRLRPQFELLGIEENPLRRESYPYDGTSQEECFNGYLFKVLRRGFGRELVRAEITGVENRTWGPMLVNRDEGRGVGFFGQVPAGKKLTLSEDGKAILDGTALTTLAFSWRGACFADRSEPGARDFVFDSPRAIFAIAIPDGALDREFSFPHAGNPVEVPGVEVGMTRMAFFVQEAHLSSLDQDPEQVRAVTPHYAIGFADESILAPATSETYPTQAELVLSWQEHEAYVLRVIIPPRFRLLDGDGLTITAQVEAALERFRPAGVTIRVEYRNDNWVLGQSPVLDQAAADPNLMLMGGTRLSPS